MNVGYFGVFWRIFSGILVYHYPPPLADPDNSTTGCIQPPLSSHLPKGGYLMEVQPSNEPGGKGGELPYKSDSDARQKIEIKPLRETNVGAV